MMSWIFPGYKILPLLRASKPLIRRRMIHLVSGTPLPRDLLLIGISIPRIIIPAQHMRLEGALNSLVHLLSALVRSIKAS